MNAAAASDGLRECGSGCEAIQIEHEVGSDPALDRGKFIVRIVPCYSR